MDDVSSEGTVTSSGGFSHGEIVELSEVVSPKDPKLLEERKPAPLTRKQIGELRRMYITVVNAKVTACNHPVKFSATRSPNSNCIECWRAFFMTCVDLEGIHIVLTKQGVKALEKQKGRKYVRMFHGFLTQSLLPSLKAEVEALVPTDPTVIEGSAIDTAS
jgi:hypothetical protein